MTAGRFRARCAATAALLGALMGATAACGSSQSAESAGIEPTGTWEEPASYVYTLTSSTQVLAGTFRVEVRNSKVTKVIGLDEDSRRQVRDLPNEVPTIGQLLKTLDRARSEDADEAEADYAADGLPVRISLDWDKNSIDDEALYTISSYEPTPG
ncbi:DUF6174 domain-containing protein [Streptomyces phaeofaciens]|uniref:Lipoprotein n=1 Tax=Streptomyces phaeofaciens TaxID=68254 RepID=A0A918HT15_9ACTN|nr:DUF6174 domain-containing protein [Streptomyces phaeofaciens]GGT99459.1 hypothetical protein GCM10010226_90730 [Streptomyces phaeofaciens]